MSPQSSPRRPTTRRRAPARLSTRSAAALAAGLITLAGVVGTSGAVTLDDVYEVTYADGTVVDSPVDLADPALPGTATAQTTALRSGIATAGATVEDGLYGTKVTGTTGTSGNTGDAAAYNRGYYPGHGRIVNRRKYKRWHGHNPFHPGRGDHYR